VKRPNIAWSDREAKPDSSCSKGTSAPPPTRGFDDDAADVAAAGADCCFSSTTSASLMHVSLHLTQNIFLVCPFSRTNGVPHCGQVSANRVQPDCNFDAKEDTVLHKPKQGNRNAQQAKT
jgi:hypothetical protein